MGTKSLKDDLDNFIISFNQRVLLTDLMDEYEMPFTEVENIVQSHIKQQEKRNCIKCEKRYLINGQEEKSGNEIYTVVPQSQLDIWLKKLKESESKLYSVELIGGSKTAAQEVKPLRFCTIGYKESNKSNSSQNVNIKEDTKKQTKNENSTSKEVLIKTQEVVKNIDIETNVKIEKKGVIEKKKTSPVENKIKAKPLKDKDQIVKNPASPKKLNDFFKKNAKPPQKKVEANSSIQLFEEDEDVEQAKAAIETEVPSSDEEEMLDAMRREICNNNSEEEKEEKHATGGSKRRRIVDSDDDKDEDEQPQAKQEKTAASTSATYLDDDGFVLTVKSKKNAVFAATSTQSNKKVSPPAKKSSPMKNKLNNSKKPPPKTKQGNITSFFTKK